MNDIMLSVQKCLMLRFRVDDKLNNFGKMHQKCLLRYDFKFVLHTQALTKN